MREHARVCMRMCVVLQVLGQVLQVLGRMCVVLQVLSRSVVLQVLGRMCVVLQVLGLLQVLGQVLGLVLGLVLVLGLGLVLGLVLGLGGAFTAHRCSATHQTLFLPNPGNPGASE